MLWPAVVIGSLVSCLDALNNKALLAYSFYKTAGSSIIISFATTLGVTLYQQNAYAFLQTVRKRMWGISKRDVKGAISAQKAQSTLAASSEEFKNMVSGPFGISNIPVYPAARVLLWS